jgi:hypothetical protein
VILEYKFVSSYFESIVKGGTVKTLGTKLALVLAAIPFVTLVFALPLVNRLEPVILGLPFLLFWILFWVVLTPPILFVAYVCEKKFNKTDEGEDQ